jgi:hypothetical protein
MHSIWLCAKSELFMKMMNKRQLIEFCETGEGKLGLLPWELAIETMVGLDAVHPRAQRVFVDIWVKHPFRLDDEDLLYAWLRKITPNEEEAMKLLAMRTAGTVIAGRRKGRIKLAGKKKSPPWEALQPAPVKARTVQEFDRHLDQIEQEQLAEPRILHELQSEFNAFSQREAVPPELAQRYTRVVRASWRRFADEWLSTCEEAPQPDRGLLNAIKTMRDIYARAGEETLPDGKLANSEIESRLAKLDALVPSQYRK